MDDCMQGRDWGAAPNTLLKVVAFQAHLQDDWTAAVKREALSA